MGMRRIWVKTVNHWPKPFAFQSHSGYSLPTLCKKNHRSTVPEHDNAAHPVVKNTD